MSDERFANRGVKPLISVDYVQLMARYNEWQNTALIAAADTLNEEELRQDRGAFFGSIQRTLNHILWGDRIWMALLDDWKKPDCGIAESPEICLTYAAWLADRQRADGRIRVWADRLRPADLRGVISWYSGATGRDVTRPASVCIAHMFNHQTHHRGQVHAMLTAAGATTSMTDLVFIPEDF